METTNPLLKNLHVSGLPTNLNAFFSSFMNDSFIRCWVLNVLTSIRITGIEKIIKSKEDNGCENTMIFSAAGDARYPNVLIVATFKTLRPYKNGERYDFDSVLMYKGSYESYILQSNALDNAKQLQDMHDEMPDHRS